MCSCAAHDLSLQTGGHFGCNGRQNSRTSLPPHHPPPPRFRRKQGAAEELCSCSLAWVDSVENHFSSYLLTNKYLPDPAPTPQALSPSNQHPPVAVGTPCTPVINPFPTNLQVHPVPPPSPPRSGAPCPLLCHGERGERRGGLGG